MPRILLVKPDANGPGINRIVLREFHADLAEVFDATAPVLILREEARPGPDLERFLPAPSPRLASTGRSCCN